MEKETSSKGFDIWLQKQLKISIDRRKSFERRVINRRAGLDRRMFQIEVSVEKRTGNERRAYK